VGPYEGKQTGELALLRDLLNAFEEKDLVVPSRLRACFDRYYCPFEAQGMSYMMLAIPSRLRPIFNSAWTGEPVWLLRNADFRAESASEFENVVP
jgi:hypothetical protein